MWERGLKHVLGAYLVYQLQSLPMWERGLKHFIIFACVVYLGRSPCGSVD